MKVTKMHGAGNDYIYVNCFEETVADPHRAARELSDRHFWIGSDGLVLIKPSEIADFEMDMYNSDGSRAEMCGNAIRCVGKYVYDNGLTDKTNISIATGAGIKYLELFVCGGKVTSARVDMGEPILAAEEIPCRFEGEPVVSRPINVNGKDYSVTCVSMGNPHAVLYVDDVDALELEKIGPGFENHEIFPRRTNTEFVQVVSPTLLRMRVWERGAGETWACGTGACASLVATVLNGLCDRKAVLSLRGGELTIEWDENTNHVFMTGPATTVFTTEIDYK